MGLFLSASPAAAHTVWAGVGEGALGQCLSRDPVGCRLSVPALLQLHKCRCSLSQEDAVFLALCSRFAPVPKFYPFFMVSADPRSLMPALPPSALLPSMWTLLPPQPSSPPRSLPPPPSARGETLAVEHLAEGLRGVGEDGGEPYSE